MLSVELVYYSLFLFFSLVSFFLSLWLMVLDYSVIIEFNMISVGASSFSPVFLFDWMSLLFMSFVMFISSMVIFYSGEYMLGDKSFTRFILLVVMFVFSMILMILSPNLVSILLGWDGLGLVSYCLVIYYQNVKSSSAGMLTALSNRIGDVALLMAIGWMLNFGSWSFIYYLDVIKDNWLMQIITFFVVLASLTKSAQIPFSSWLPAAMAAPTPVSSLVHSSTLVTAGVYLLVRFQPAFSYSISTCLVFLSSLTMFMSGLGANFEYDLKKIIALSTLSQLGLMMSILALGDVNVAFFHLLTHALFKALLFMCSGSFIHSMGNYQDIRFMGAMIKHLPLTCTFFNICNFSLCGLPFLSGFYSKDLGVEIMSFNYVSFYIYMIFYLSVGLTVSYSFRLFYYSLVGNFNFISLNCLDEKSFIMLKGMSGLIFLVIFMGSVLNWLIFKYPIFLMLPIFMKLLTLVAIFLGAWLGYLMAQFKLSYMMKSLSYLPLTSFLGSMWNLPLVSTYGLSYIPLLYGGVYLSFLEQGWFEYYGGKGMANLTFKLVYILQLFSLNYFKIYFSLVLVWLLFIFLN
nr:NADH dehydrogenase subunit 5 [Sagra femorata]